MYTKIVFTNCLKQSLKRAIIIRVSFKVSNPDSVRINKLINNNIVPIQNKHIFLRPKKKCAYVEKCAYFGKMCLFWEVEDFASKVQSIPYRL